MPIAYFSQRTGESGEVDEALLVKTEGSIDNDIEHTTWVEYRWPEKYGDEIIHRSVDIKLKKAVNLTGETQSF